ncbi:MAG TPA: BON domain-containing protein [Candidatus Acidoferrales bacterium]|nr:BON domain-containing protein [Candidatus Acidoferrales bacterium]
MSNRSFEWKIAVVGAIVAGLVGCASNRAPDVESKVRDALRQAGLNDVSVSQNRDKGVVTLGGTVAQDADKTRAEQIAKPIAANQVVADEIAVRPADNASVAKSIDSDIDKGIDSNLDAALKAGKMNGVSHSTKNGVVTLKGKLKTPAQRTEAEQIATRVPNVQQVVNEIDVTNRRATSSSPRSSTGSADRSK